MYSARVEKLMGRLEEEGLDALLVTSLPNAYYLSGFTGSTAMLLLTNGRKWFITDSRYHEQVEQEVDASYELFDNTNKKLAEDVLPALPGQELLKRIGFESEHVSHSLYSKMAEADGREFISTSGWIEDLRVVKDKDEIERIRQAVLLNEKVYREVLSTINGGTTEADLAAEIEYRARKLGAESTSFSPIVASGPNSSKPHAGFTQQKLVPGAPLTFDMGVKLDAYCSDMTRTVFFKDCPPKWEEIYKIVWEAKEMAHGAIQPGIKGSEVDKAAREHIHAAGHGEHFGHGLGHGIGIEVHEAPRLAKTGEQELAAGHVVSNEPGIYLPGEGGVRIEDLVAVTQDGGENLNTLPTSVEVVG